MEIALVANDFAPSAALDLLAQELESRGLKAKPWLNFGKNNLDFTEMRVDADVLVAGMSSSSELSRVEFNALVYAHAQSVPIALYADVWDCAAREWFAPIRTYVSLLFVVDEQEREQVQHLFPKAKVVVSGNPLWERSRYVTYSRVDVRKQLSVCESDKVAICALTKNRGVNLDILSAAGQLVREVGVKAIACLHPGDTTPCEEYRLGDETGVFPARNRAQHILPAADMVLNAASGLGIEAVFQGIPVLEYRSPAIDADINRTYPRGWPLPGCYPHLAKTACAHTLIAESKRLLATKLVWKGVVGEPEILTSVHLMADEIELLASRKGRC